MISGEEKVLKSTQSKPNNKTPGRGEAEARKGSFHLAIERARELHLLHMTAKWEAIEKLEDMMKLEHKQSMVKAAKEVIEMLLKIK